MAIKVHHDHELGYYHVHNRFPSPQENWVYILALY